MKKLLPIIFISSFLSMPVYAGPYTDTLSKCIVDSTSKKDQDKLVKWMFVALTQHSVSSGMVDISKEQIESANKDYAELTVRLLTSDCKNEAIKAVEIEGAIAITKSFEFFGKFAGGQIFSEPNVVKTMSSFEKYLDSEKLEAIMSPK